VSASGVITTFAGGGKVYTDGVAATNAQFAFPTAVAGDAAGDIFIADPNNNWVRKVAPNRIISTVAGTGGLGYSGDGGAATSAQLIPLSVWQWTRPAPSIFRSTTIRPFARSRPKALSVQSLAAEQDSPVTVGPLRTRR